MRTIFVLLPVAALLMACQPASQARQDPFSANGQVIAMGGGRGGAANACFRCHGLRGEGDKISVPRLAGLEAGYLRKQLDDYALQLRPDPAMHEAARWLSQRERQAVAAYYASMPSPARTGEASPPVSPPGPWRTGDASRDLIACSACHGEDGRGIGSGYPALAGQPAAYTVDQIEAWRDGQRRNDPRGLMSIAVARLRPAETRAIAVWLEQQSASPRPYSDAARLSGAEEAAARLEASRGGRRPGR